jgi:hypothetical protein
MNVKGRKWLQLASARALSRPSSPETCLRKAGAFFEIDVLSLSYNGTNTARFSLLFLLFSQFLSSLIPPIHLPSGPPVYGPRRPRHSMVQDITISTTT